MHGGGGELRHSSRSSLFVTGRTVVRALLSDCAEIFGGGQG